MGCWPVPPYQPILAGLFNARACRQKMIQYNSYLLQLFVTAICYNVSRHVTSSRRAHNPININSHHEAMRKQQQQTDRRRGLQRIIELSYLYILHETIRGAGHNFSCLFAKKGKTNNDRYVHHCCRCGTSIILL